MARMQLMQLQSVKVKGCQHLGAPWRELLLLPLWLEQLRIHMLIERTHQFCTLLFDELVDLWLSLMRGGKYRHRLDDIPRRGLDCRLLLLEVPYGWRGLWELQGRSAFDEQRNYAAVICLMHCEVDILIDWGILSIGVSLWAWQFFYEETLRKAVR